MKISFIFDFRLKKASPYGYFLYGNIFIHWSLSSPFSIWIEFCHFRYFCWIIFSMDHHHQSIINFPITSIVCIVILIKMEMWLRNSETSSSSLPLLWKINNPFYFLNRGKIDQSINHCGKTTIIIFIWHLFDVYSFASSSVDDDDFNLTYDKDDDEDNQDIRLKSFRIKLLIDRM